MDTSTNTPRIRKQPKLRASCDGCGASKLKCDRGLPECERCVAHSIPCVYGVSRKMGKPRRDGQQTKSIVVTAIDDLGRTGSATGSTPGRGTGATHLAAGGATEQPSPSVTVAAGNIAATTCDLEGLDDVDLGVLTGLYRQDGHHQPWPGLPASFPALDFIDWASIADHAGAHDDVAFSATSLHFSGPIPNTPEIESPDVRSHSSAGTPATQPAATPHSSSETSGQPSTAGSIQGGGHDCTPEAYDILRTLSSLDRHLGTGSAPCGLDHVLRLNRKASEQLDRLLACPCARSPHLALLYVSIIARILNWYHQAASGTTAAQTRNSLSSWGSPATCPSTAGTTACITSLESETRSTSSVASLQSSSPGISSAASTAGASISGSGPNPTCGALAVGLPVKMVIGTFDVDDLSVQNALKIQLLSGELRRAGWLIDQLAVHYSAASAASTSNPRHPSGPDDTVRFLLHGGGMGTGTNTSSLYQSLDSWLRAEHGRITNMMRLKLIEFNA